MLYYLIQATANTASELALTVAVRIRDGMSRKRTVGPGSSLAK